MRTIAVVGWCLLMVVGFVLVATRLDLQQAREARDAARHAEQIAQARYAEEATKSERVADTVVREVTRTRTLRDSVLLRLTDTSYIQKFVYQTDTLVVSCERCAEQLRALRVAADSTIRAKDLRIAALKPRFRDRCGFSLGVGALRDGTTLRAGPVRLGRMPRVAMTVYRCACPCHGSEWGVPIADVVEAAVACDTCKDDHVAVFKPDFPAPKPWTPERDATGDEGRET